MLPGDCSARSTSGWSDHDRSRPRFRNTSLPRTDLMDLSVSLGRLQLANPIMVASGTFGYAREMEGIVDVSRLGAVLPKTITAEPRIGNAPWRTVETAAGLLNAIGLTVGVKRAARAGSAEKSAVLPPALSTQQSAFSF